MSLNPLEQLDVLAIAAVAAIFLATFVALRKLIFLPLLEVLEARRHALDAAHARDEASRALLDGAERDAKAIVATATEAAHRSLEQLEDELARERRETTADAQDRAQAILAAGREELARIRAELDQKLEVDLLECSRLALAKIGGEVGEDTLRLAVRRALAASKSARRR